MSRNKHEEATELYSENHGILMKEIKDGEIYRVLGLRELIF